MKRTESKQIFHFYVLVTPIILFLELKIDLIIWK